jgi:hypothetical protein
LLQLGEGRWIYAANSKYRCGSCADNGSGLSEKDGSFGTRDMALLNGAMELRADAEKLANGKHCVGTETPSQRAAARKMEAWAAGLILECHGAAAVGRLEPGPKNKSNRTDNGKDAGDIKLAEFSVWDAVVDLGAAVKLLKPLEGKLALSQEMYHAEKAADHLSCLHKLLKSGGVFKNSHALRGTYGPARGGEKKRPRTPGRRLATAPLRAIDPNGVFVLHRTPMHGSKTSSGKHRYKGVNGDWTLDPNKVQAFPTLAAAGIRRHSGDFVETLAQAQRRFA